MIAESDCADVVELDTDHTPHLSMPNELAQALHRFAKHSPKPDCGLNQFAEQLSRAVF